VIASQAGLMDRIESWMLELDARLAVPTTA
jgi:hypothetical protein